MVADGRMVFGMTDYISRDLIIKWIEKILELFFDRFSTDQKNMFGLFRSAVEDKGLFPSADVVERRRGEWMKAVQGLDESWVCSECMEEYVSVDADFKDYAHFCPNCGADMRSKDGE